MRNIQAKYIGLITGGLMIGLALILFYQYNLEIKGTTGFVIWGIYAAGIIWSLMSFKSSGAEDHSFKQYFSQGFKTFIVVALMMVVFYFHFL